MDLLSSHPFWPIRDGLPVTFPPLDANVSCDVAVVGSGITGALVAWSLATAGIDVVVLDRREAAHGSTAGNTGLVLYELDEMLHRLASRIGAVAAGQAYRRCHRAVADFEALLRSTRIECGYCARQSLYVAAVRGHVPRLCREFEARRAAGFEIEWWPRARIAAGSSLPHAAAILSTGAAEIDPY
ncbi:MAG: NAD(P)/FAD-dependent oxidoreductase, partial [Opitutaceae bacterium]